MSLVTLLKFMTNVVLCENSISFDRSKATNCIPLFFMVAKFHFIDPLRKMCMHLCTYNFAFNFVTFITPLEPPMTTPRHPWQLDLTISRAVHSQPMRHPRVDGKNTSASRLRKSRFQLLSSGDKNVQSRGMWFDGRYIWISFTIFWCYYSLISLFIGPWKWCI